jgi:cytochrome c-type biogenesis protein
VNIDILRSAVEHVGFPALGVAVLAGFLFSFNPVALAAIPVSLAYVTRAQTTSRAAFFGTMFAAGMVLTHVLLGFAAGLGGVWVQKLLGREWGLALGPLLIVLGLVWVGWLRVPLPAVGIRAMPVKGAWGAFLLGVPFAVAICPVCTPALVVMLGVAAGIGSPFFGAALLLAFALGRAVPLGLGALAIGWLEHLRPLGKGQRAFEITGGVTLILSGLYLLNVYFVIVPSLAL